jgi:SAM-dependent methyltransferase
VRRRVDYDEHGGTYSRHRRADPRIEARIHAALGDARTVLNVGAGSGSYEPADRWVLAVEPSATMRAQRPPGAPPALAARAEALPLDEDAVEAAMACVTIHHWENFRAGLAEMRRVARGPVVVFTFELDRLPAWQLDFLRDGVEIERRRFPPLAEIAAVLGGRARIESIPTPADCADGFFEAFWNRPEALLDPSIRASQSIWPLLDPGGEERIVARLRAALESGAWDAEHGHLRAMDSYDGALRLVVSEPEARQARSTVERLDDSIV